MAHFTVDCGEVHREVRSFEEAWCIALELRDSTGGPVLVSEWSSADKPAPIKQQTPQRVGKKGKR